ncbi:MAG: hypothetical protein ACE37J_14355 [Pikeienuella sp.]|uniref:hypothetical protein n=1 Tax=Pikeienuella sp. TaxID=2831957 RepID=UPI00391967C5
MQAIMAETLAGGGWLLACATLAYILGFLFRDQAALRTLLLLGSAFYIAYYYMRPEPLWGAIAASLAINAANLFGLLRLLYSRHFTILPAASRPVFAAMRGLQPGEFRALMRLGEPVEPARALKLTTEGVTPEYLWFVTRGKATAEKAGRRFALPAMTFIGEISFVLKEPASATVALEAGGAAIRWRRDRLAAALRRAPQLERAVEALIARDMARKVADGVHIGAGFRETGAREAGAPAPRDLSSAHVA